MSDKLPTLPMWRGDDWPGYPTLIIDINGEPPELPIASARIQFRETPGSEEVGYTLSTAPEAGQGTITIVDAAGWELSIPKQPLPLAAKRKPWKWDLEIIDTGGTVVTYEGQPQQVNQDITR